VIYKTEWELKHRGTGRNMEQRIMVVLNAGELASTVRDALSQQAFDVRYVEGFANARKMVIGTRPDLILIDIASWAKNVEELLCDFDNLASSAKVEDRALALESGADDFLMKPISTREFSARLKATLRSYVSAHSVGEPSLGVLRLRRNEMERYGCRILSLMDWNVARISKLSGQKSFRGQRG
jgi:two-component system KDP operon response regulator KdpE